MVAMQRKADHLVLIVTLQRFQAERLDSPWICYKKKGTLIS